MPEAIHAACIGVLAPRSDVGRPVGLPTTFVAGMALRPGAKDRPVGVLENGCLGIDRLAALVPPLGRIVRDRPAEQPKNPPRDAKIAAPWLQLAWHGCLQVISDR